MTRDKLIAGLNTEQIEVVEHDRGPCLVAACAGAGKTEAVVRRMAYLVAVRGVREGRIFGTTFSRRAAGEMNVRVARLLGSDTAVRVQTFHAFCRHVLAEEFHGFSSWTLDERDTYRDLLKKAAGYENMDWKGADIEELSTFVELAKAGAVWPNTPAIEALAKSFYDARPSPPRNPQLTAQAYSLAEKLRVDSRLMTFADWMMEVDKLFENEHVRARWAALVDYVIVDEAQDNSMVQVKIAERMSADHRNLMMIGDASQSIYKWRGAIPEYFTGFPAKWGARVITMFRNYRSVQSVVDAANTVLEEMVPAPHPMECMRVEEPLLLPGRRPSSDVVVRSYETKELEATGVVDEITALHDDGVAWRDTVVLYRVNALSRAVEEIMNERGIPYRVTGSACFYLRKEIVGLLAYLKVAWRYGATMQDVQKSLFSPHRKLGKVFMGHVETAATEKPASFVALVDRAMSLSTRLIPAQRYKAEQWGTLIDRMRADIAEGGEASNPGSLIQRVVDTTLYNEWLKNDEGRDAPENDRTSNVAELICAARRFKDAGAFLEHVRTQIAAAREHKDDEKRGDHVTLMSVHRSKGLEWKHVFLVSCQDGIMPHAYADDVAEERRIFYVAVTRAMDSIHISHPEFAVSMGYQRTVNESPFLKSFRGSDARQLEVPMPELPAKAAVGIEGAKVIKLFPRRVDDE